MQAQATEPRTIVLTRHPIPADGTMTLFDTNPFPLLSANNRATPANRCWNTSSGRMV